MKSLNERMGKKWTYFFGCIIGIIAYTWIYFGRGDNYKTFEIYGVCALIGVAGSTMLISSLGMTNDLIGHNTSSGAFVFGAMSFLDKVSNGLAVMTIQTFHDVSGNGNPMFYRNVLTFVCGGATIMALFALLLLSRQSLGARKRKMCQLPKCSIEDDCPLPDSDQLTDSSVEADIEDENEIRKPLIAKNGATYRGKGENGSKIVQS
jgi:hypothetical protein